MTLPGLSLGALGGVLSGSPTDEPAAGLREFRDVLAALRAEGAAVPADTARAMALHDQVIAGMRADAMGDTAAVVARVDLAALDAGTLLEAVRVHAVHRAARESNSEGGVTAGIRAALLDRARGALAVDLPAVLAPLVEPFRVALSAVQRAVDVGITSASDPAAVIDLGTDEAVAAWRALVAADGAVGRATRLWLLRCRLVRVVGGYVPPAPPPAQRVDPLAEGLAALQGRVYTEDPSTAPTGVPDGFARRGRAAWLDVVTAGHDLLVEFAEPARVPARRHERDPRAIVPLDAPSEFDLEWAALVANPTVHATETTGRADDRTVRTGELEQQQWASGMPGIVIVPSDEDQPVDSTSTDQRAQLAPPGARRGSRTSRVGASSSDVVTATADDDGIDSLGGMR